MEELDVMDKRNIVVIGTSAGGLRALIEVISSLPANFPAVIFIVHHLSPENTGQHLLQELSKHTNLPCKFPEDKERFHIGTIYFAPTDFHLLIKRDRVLVKKGARENRYRPGIDPLFRSAAVAHGARVIGIVLTGLLDDGTAGLIAIKHCGGITIVQDPKNAEYPDMPQSAINNASVDYCVPTTEMGPILEKLTKDFIAKGKAAPKDIKIEARIAERVLSNMEATESLGEQVPYNCPNCGGVLWQMSSHDITRYRCHTGHSFTDSALLISQNEKIEETLWISLRMFEERKNLLANMGQKEDQVKRKNFYLKRATESDIHIERIRAMLLKSEVSK